MEYLAEASLKSASGTVYRFDVHDLRASFRNVGAVYVFARRMPSLAVGPTFLPLYVGQSAELGKRIRRHEKWRRVELAGGTSICVIPVADEARRLEIEADLLAALVTPCNQKRCQRHRLTAVERAGQKRFGRHFNSRASYTCSARILQPAAKSCVHDTPL